MLRTRVEKAKMIKVTAIAPTNAANKIAVKPLKFTVSIDTLPPKNSITTATAKAAPLFIPNIPGPARGLRKAV